MKIPNIIWIYVAISKYIPFLYYGHASLGRIKIGGRYLRPPRTETFGSSFYLASPVFPGPAIPTLAWLHDEVSVVGNIQGRIENRDQDDR
jgi:hypothetical protein